MLFDEERVYKVSFVLKKRIVPKWKKDRQKKKKKI
jgi:hypothetical protein